MSWTIQNTDGFTQSELDEINRAIELLRVEWNCAGLDDKSLNDAIGNSIALVPLDASSLANAAARRLKLSQ